MRQKSNWCWGETCNKNQSSWQVAQHCRLNVSSLCNCQIKVLYLVKTSFKNLKKKRLDTFQNFCVGNMSLWERQRLKPKKHACTHLCTQIHTQKRKNTHISTAQTHTHTCTCTHTHTHKTWRSLHKYTHIPAHARMHACTYANTEHTHFGTHTERGP